MAPSFSGSRALPEGGRPNVSEEIQPSFAGGDLGAAFDPAGPALDYVIDLSQRMILFWDVMRRRGAAIASIWLDRAARAPVQVELVVDGRTSSDLSTTGWCGSCHLRG